MINIFNYIYKFFNDSSTLEGATKMKKLFIVLSLSGIAYTFADGFSGNLVINTTTLTSPYINASNNTIIDKNNPSAGPISGYYALTSGINNLAFNTVRKNGGFMPYNISFGLNFGGVGLSASSIAWRANGDTPGSSYTFSITPYMYPAGQTPASGDYCIVVSVNGNEIASPVCTVAIQKGDSFPSNIWYDPAAIVNVTVPDFLANSSVNVQITPGNAQKVICTRSSEWATPSCQVASSSSVQSLPSKLKMTPVSPSSSITKKQLGEEVQIF